MLDITSFRSTSRTHIKVGLEQLGLGQDLEGLTRGIGTTVWAQQGCVLHQEHVNGPAHPYSAKSG